MSICSIHQLSIDSWTDYLLFISFKNTFWFIYHSWVIQSYCNHLAAHAENNSMTLWANIPFINFQPLSGSFIFSLSFSGHALVYLSTRAKNRDFNRQQLKQTTRAWVGEHTFHLSTFSHFLGFVYLRFVPFRTPYGLFINRCLMQSDSRQVAPQLGVKT